MQKLTWALHLRTTLLSNFRSFTACQFLDNIVQNGLRNTASSAQWDILQYLFCLIWKKGPNAILFLQRVTWYNFMHTSLKHFCSFFEKLHLAQCASIELNKKSKILEIAKLGGLGRWFQNS